MKKKAKTVMFIKLDTVKPVNSNPAKWGHLVK
jgi:hypothetical protein